MSTNFVGKWDRFTAHIVIADKFGRFVGWTKRIKVLSENYAAANGKEGKQ
jgi:hypothetical protein